MPPSLPVAKGKEVGKMINEMIENNKSKRLDINGAIRDLAAGATRPHQTAPERICPQRHQAGEHVLDQDSHEVTFIDNGLMQKHSKGGKPNYIKS